MALPKVCYITIHDTNYTRRLKLSASESSFESILERIRKKFDDVLSTEFACKEIDKLEMFDENINKNIQVMDIEDFEDLEVARIEVSLPILY